MKICTGITLYVFLYDKKTKYFFFAAAFLTALPFSSITPAGFVPGIFSCSKANIFTTGWLKTFDPTINTRKNNRIFFINILLNRFIQDFVVYKSNLKKMLMVFEKAMVFTPFKTSRVFLLLSVLFSVIIIGCKSPASDTDEKLEMDGMARAMRQQFMMTRDPALNIVPTERLLAAMRAMNNARTTQINNLTWTERGPNNIGGP